VKKSQPFFIFCQIDTRTLKGYIITISKLQYNKKGGSIMGAALQTEEGLIRKVLERREIERGAPRFNIAVHGGHTVETTNGVERYLAKLFVAAGFDVRHTVEVSVGKRTSCKQKEEIKALEASIVLATEQIAIKQTQLAQAAVAREKLKRIQKIL
jgi:hypothetical protein